MKKKINIGIIGTIGCGKTTLMNNLSKELSKDNKEVIVQPEPSVTIPFVNDVLKKFYNDNVNWSFPLQLCISSAQEAYMQTLRETEYDYAIMDAPYSSDIYGYSHAKNNRMRLEDFHALLGIGRPFKFDTIIWIHEDKETTIQRIKNRNADVKAGNRDEDKKDVEIEDFSYLDSHIADFEEYMPMYLNRFKLNNPNVKIIELSHVPDLDTKEYDDLINSIIETIDN